MHGGRDTHTEWVSIGDFMAGIVGILILFFVIAVLITATARHEAAKKKSEGIRAVMASIANSLSQEGGGGLTVLPEQGTIRLKDTSFSKGSACLDDAIRRQLQEVVGPVIRHAMQADPGVRLQIEGHSDTSPVGRVSSNVTLVCAPFDDNYTLSAGRAREARKALLANLDDPSLNSRLSVVGYGPDRLLNPVAPTSAENRRVELRLLKIGD